MPQPATHYLVTRRAIPQEHWGGWWDKYKPYFGFGSSAPDLFYFPLMPTAKARDDIVWENLANPLHSSRSYDMFCTLLSKAKQHKLAGDHDADKQFAFSFGYYCHVVTDCIFHPYVHRSTGDHWNSKEYKDELDHKVQEFWIDSGIYQRYYDKTQNFSRIQWACNNGESELLDFSIAGLFHETLLEIYPDCYPYSPDIADINHPIQQAYSAMAQSIRTLFEGTEIYLWGRRIPVDTGKFRSKYGEAFFSAPYPKCSTLDSFTPEELFNFACSACRRIFLLSLSFWKSPDLSAKEYFASSEKAHYLNAGNWNLDTGLPCQYNNYKLMREESSEHYSFKVDELKRIFATLQAEYNPEDFHI